MIQLLMHGRGMWQCPGGLRTEEMSAIGRHGAEAVDTELPIRTGQWEEAEDIGGN